MGEQGLKPSEESTKMKIRNTNPIMAKLFSNKKNGGYPTNESQIDNTVE